MIFLAAPRAIAAQDSLTSLPPGGERNVGVLRPGDMLRVLIYREKELSGEFPIDARGFVQIPGLGDLHVGGLSPVDVKVLLRQQLVRRGIGEPEIAVHPLIRVYVLGEVQQPGPYPVDPGTSLLQIVAQAGGPTNQANLGRARVVREGKAFGVDLRSALAGSAAGRVVLYSNDVVVVPRKTGFTRENLSFLFGTVTVVLSVLNLIAVRRN